ncbi:hypothetical protein [Actinomadura sp. 9N407]|uniref:hypothetical protein n=1 Tax=Actinomadura sp. 9N407 TaxID=3375154 RepID=UPI0037A74353
MRCTHCGATELQPGYLEDTGQASRGFVRWVAGPPEMGIRRAKRWGRKRFQVEVFRCPQCSHLESFAVNPD